MGDEVIRALLRRFVSWAFRCEVCQGKGRVPVSLPGFKATEKCITCKGKGHYPL